MPTYKSVYFAPDGKWFETRRECEEYEKIIEISNAIDAISIHNIDAIHIAKALLARYTIEERWDYKADPTKDNSPTVTPEEDSKI